MTISSRSPAPCATIVCHGGDFAGTNTQLDLYLRSGYTLIVLANMERPAASGIADAVRDWIAAKRH
jgi:hypothetical protein